MTPTPFKIFVPDAVLSDLRRRLADTRWPDEAPNSGWEYGSHLGYMKELVEYWAGKYDWRASEALLNRFEQFTVPLDGIGLHFIHQPGIGPHPRPLLLSHGWPGSVWEFYKIIPMLTDPRRFGGDPADAFTVIAPSLPGYGFSFRPNQPRFGISAIADTFASLMTDVLGFPRFFAAGGDWGSSITARLAYAYPTKVPAIHLTMASIRPETLTQWPETEAAKQYLAALEAYGRESRGYMAIQGTRPQTLAYGLTDSPAGLASWIVEKFRAWSDCGGEVEQRFTKDELLTNIMLYWVTGAIGSSFWPYFARAHGEWAPSERQRIETPTGHAVFPKENNRPPRELAERVYNIQRWTQMNAGGHFAALEEPEALAAELRAFFRDY